MISHLLQNSLARFFFTIFIVYSSHCIPYRMFGYVLLSPRFCVDAFPKPFEIIMGLNIVKLHADADKM